MADDPRGEAPLGTSGDDSPWARDVPIRPAPPLPDAWTRPPASASDPDTASHGTLAGTPVVERKVVEREVVEPIITVADPHTIPDPSTVRANRRRRSIVVASVVGILIAAAIGAQLIGDSGGEPVGGGVDDTDQAAPSSPAPRPTELPPVETRPSRPARPSPPVTSAPETLPEPEPTWVSSPITLGPRFQAMTVPTQVVVLNFDGIVHVIDVPAGMLRSIDTGATGPNLTLVAGDDAIAVSSPGSEAITLVNPGGAVYDVEVPGGAGQMLARPGTNDFAVTPNEWSGSGPPTDILVAADGTTTEILDGPLREYGVWGVGYLPTTGEAVINDSGGTYAIGTSGGVRRLSNGDLVAIGQNHVLVRECDEALNCVHTRIDGRSGERLGVTAPEFADYRGYDSSISLSPDGSLMTYFDWMSATADRRLLDLSVGTNMNLDSIDPYGGNRSAWAADSSGIFLVENRRLVLHDVATGDRFEVAPGLDLGAIVAVAARPANA